jgi:hypothetical protein
MSVGFALLAVTGGCGDDGPGSGPSSDRSPMSRWGRTSSDGFGATPTPATVPSSHPTEADDDGESTDPDGGTPTALPGVEGALILSRQRDLLDRGLINVELLNVSDTEVFFVERRLEVDGFVTEPATTKLTRLGPGRRLRVQVPYGHTADCEITDSLTARLLLGVTSDPESLATAPAMVELGGVDLIEGIRRRQCAAGAIADAASVELVSVVDAGDHAEVVVAVERTAGDVPLTFVEATGTILVRTESLLADEPLTLGVDPGSSIEIDVNFVVNRCDPHALAEVTKRYGLDLHVAIGDAAPEPVPVDVADLVGLLETLVERCVRAADQD